MFFSVIDVWIEKHISWWYPQYAIATWFSIFICAMKDTQIWLVFFYPLNDFSIVQKVHSISTCCLIIILLNQNSLSSTRFTLCTEQWTFQFQLLGKFPIFPLSQYLFYYTIIVVLAIFLGLWWLCNYWNFHYSLLALSPQNITGKIL